ncbi:MAG: hypothetical protein JWQ29_2958 [Phenylobacterium sp.]|nr:hypothetical protein [Phenylobacterium sp.]
MLRSGRGSTDAAGAVLRRRGVGLGLAAACVAALAGVGVTVARSTDRPVVALIGTKSGQTRSFVVTYFYEAMTPGTVKEDCPDGLAQPPNPADYLKDLSPAQLKDLLENSANQAKLFESMTNRGPGGKSICTNPTLEPNATMPVGQSKVGYGVDLDGGKRPAGAKGCGHADLTSPDGLTGVDNQKSRLYACIQQRRQSGYLPAYEVGLMRDGEYTLLIQVSGIDDPQNDDDVDVLLTPSVDPITKSADGKVMLQHASFTASDENKFRNLMKGRIKDGVLVTAAQDIHVKSNHHRVQDTLLNAQFRLRFQPDGGLKGVVGGYEDIAKAYARVAANGYAAERLAGTYTCSGFYNALNALADGYPDPKTGKCTAISSAYTVEAIPAFIVPPKRTAGKDQPKPEARS